jgi:hypothetical protein
MRQSAFSQAMTIDDAVVALSGTSTLASVIASAAEFFLVSVVELASPIGANVEEANSNCTEPVQSPCSLEALRVLLPDVASRSHHFGNLKTALLPTCARRLLEFSSGQTPALTETTSRPIVQLQHHLQPLL